MRLALVVLLAEGHLLIEDVPGVGKTTLAKALAASIDATVRRIQFTPDLLPSDVTGVAIYDQETREFEFKPGAIFANVVVADEINRASPKTQSALLECMEERQVTVDGVSYELARPFMVMATQNPLEMEGTYPLPEAQRDRFTARVSMGYPGRDAELAMLDERAAADPLSHARPGGRRRHRARPRGRPSAGCSSPTRSGATSSPSSRPPAARPHLRLGASPARRPAAAARRARLGGAVRPRPRPARRRPGAGRAGARAPAAADRRRRPGPAQRRAGRRRPAGRPCRSRAGADLRCRAGRAGALLPDVAGPLPGGGAGGGLLLARRRCSASGRWCSWPSSSSPCRCSRPSPSRGERFRLTARRTVTPGPAAARRDGRRPPRGHQRRHPARRALGAHRAAAGRPRRRPRGSSSTGWPAGETGGAALPGARRPARPARARAAAAAAGRPVRPGRAQRRRRRHRAAARRPPGAAARARGGPAGGHGGGGEGARRTIAVHGEDDVSTREYRHGDDLRKVHWRATARTGELMVRLEERPWRAQATLLLDTRARAHLLGPAARARSAGSGPPGDDCPPPDSLEWLIEAAASIGTTLARRGAVLRTVTDAGELVPDVGPRAAQPRGPAGPAGDASGPPASRPARRDRAAVPGRRRRAGGLPARRGRPRRRRRAGPRPLRARPATPRSCPTSRAGPTPAPAAAVARLTAASRGVLARQREDAAALLRAAGWRVAVARADRSRRRGLGRPGRTVDDRGRVAAARGAGMSADDVRAAGRRGAGDAARRLRAHPGLLLGRLAAAGARRRPGRARRRSAAARWAAPRSGPRLPAGRPVRRTARRRWGRARAARAARSWSSACSPRATRRRDACSACCRPGASLADLGDVLADGSGRAPRAGDAGAAADRPARADHGVRRR